MSRGVLSPDRGKQANPDSCALSIFLTRLATDRCARVRDSPFFLFCFVWYAFHLLICASLDQKVEVHLLTVPVVDGITGDVTCRWAWTGVAGTRVYGARNADGYAHRGLHELNGD